MKQTNKLQDTIVNLSDQNLQVLKGRFYIKKKSLIEKNKYKRLSLLDLLGDGNGVQLRLKIIKLSEKTLKTLIKQQELRHYH